MLTLLSPHQTPWHKWPAGGKMAALFGAMIVVFAISAPWAMALALFLVCALYGAGGIGFCREGLRHLRPLLPFLLMVGLWHLYLGEWAQGALVLLRLTTAVAAANLVTLTTRLSDMIAVIEGLLKPLHRLGLRPKPIALAIALMIRFIPVMLARMGQLAEAWRARSPRRPGPQLILPATLAAFDDAEQVAEALRARGGAG